MNKRIWQKQWVRSTREFCILDREGRCATVRGTTVQIHGKWYRLEAELFYKTRGAARRTIRAMRKQAEYRARSEEQK